MLRSPFQLLVWLRNCPHHCDFHDVSHVSYRLWSAFKLKTHLSSFIQNLRRRARASHFLQNIGKRMPCNSVDGICPFSCEHEPMQTPEDETSCLCCRPCLQRTLGSGCAAKFINTRRPTLEICSYWMAHYSLNYCSAESAMNATCDRCRWEWQNHPTASCRSENQVAHAARRGTAHMSNCHDLLSCGSSKLHKSKVVTHHPFYGHGTAAILATRYIIDPHGSNEGCICCSPIASRSHWHKTKM